MTGGYSEQIGLRLTGDVSDLQAKMRDGGQAVHQFSQQSVAAGMSWVEFLKGRMGPAMKEFAGDHSAAIKKLSAEYAEYKRTGQAAVAAVSQASSNAAAANDRLAVSAKQTAWAMRGIPAQMTDIVVSLQAGQRPMTVLLQQGGQLKDMFGGIGPAARAMGSYVMSMVNPVTIAAAALAAVGYAAYQGSKELSAFENALITSGNAVGMSANQFGQLRDELAAMAGSKSKAAEALTTIAASGAFASDQVRMVAEAAIAMERATGTPIDKTVDKFKKLAEEPSKASAELNKQSHYLTAAVYEQIKALEDQGNTMQASAVALKAYADASSSTAKQIIDNSGYLEKAARGVAGAWKWAWDQVLGIGRDQTGAEQLAGLKKRLADREAAGPFHETPELFKTTNDGLRQQIAFLERLNTQLDANAKAQGDRARADQAAQAAIDAVMQANEKGWSRQKQMNKALDEYHANIQKIRAANPASALLDPKEIAAAEKAIRDQFKETAKAKPFVSPEAVEAAKQYAKYFEDFSRLQVDATSKTGDLNKAQQKLVEYLTSPAYQQHSEAMRQIVLQQAYAAVGAEQLRAAQDELAKAYAQFSKAQAESESKAVTDIEKRVAELKHEADTYGMLESQIQRVILARQEEAARGITSTDDMEAMQRVIEARKQLIAQLGGKELREANKRAADASAREWERVADAFTDNLMRGGKSVAQYLKDLFRTLVLRPILAPVGQAAVGMVGSAMGMPAAAAQGAGTSALGSAAGSWLGSTAVGGSLMSGFSGASAAMAGGSTFGVTGAVGGYSAAIGTGGTGLAGAAGSMGAGASSALGAIPVYGWIALAALAAYALMKGGETRSGGKYINGNFLEGPSGGEINGDATRTAIGATMDSINGTLKALGSSATLSGLESGFESSKNGKGFAYAGGTLSTGATFGQTTALGYLNRRGSMTPEQAAAAFGEELKQATLQALQAADVPGQLGDYLRQLGDIDKLSGGALDAALAKISKALGERTTLEDRLFELTHTAMEVQTRDRRRERDALDESNHALYDQITALQDQKAAAEAAAQAEITARDALVQAYQREQSALQDTIDRHRQYAQQLRDARDAMVLGDGSVLGLQGRTAEALRQYRGTYSQALLGDQAAASKLQDAGTAYLAALRDSAATKADYDVAFAQVAAELTIAASAQDAAATVAQSQLDVMTGQLSALGVLTDTVQAGFQQLLDAYRLTRTNPALLTSSDVPHFAAGGWHEGGLALVGEQGPELAYFPPARIYSASQTRDILGGDDALVQEVRALRADVARLLEASSAGAHHAWSAAKTLTEIDRRGVQIRDRDDQTVPSVHTV